jgi:hypothetical protein
MLILLVVDRYENKQSIIDNFKLDKFNMNDVDITKKEDLERFVISHIYYITQGSK